MGYEDLPSEGPYSPSPQLLEVRARQRLKSETAIEVVMKFDELANNIYHMCFPAVAK